MKQSDSHHPPVTPHAPAADPVATARPGEPVPLMNIANILTISRIILVPIFVWVLWDPTVTRRWLALAIFALAALTDKLDGHLARSRNLITDFGKLADSIADKALVISALLMLSWHGWMWWWVTALFIARELGITLMRMVLAKYEVMAAGRGGKLKMVLQVVFICGYLIPWNSFLPTNIATVFMVTTQVVMWAALALSLGSAGEYLRDGYRIAKRTRADDTGSAAHS